MRDPRWSSVQESSTHDSHEATDPAARVALWNCYPRFTSHVDILSGYLVAESTDQIDGEIVGTIRCCRGDFGELFQRCILQVSHSHTTGHTSSDRTDHEADRRADLARKIGLSLCSFVISRGQLQAYAAR